MEQPTFWHRIVGVGALLACVGLAGALWLALAEPGADGLARGSGPWSAEAETLIAHVSLADSRGLEVGSDIRLSGRPIGHVAALDLNPDTLRDDATLSLVSSFDIAEDSSVTVAQDGIIGAWFLALEPGRSGFDLEPGGHLTDRTGGAWRAFLREVGL